MGMYDNVAGAQYYEKLPWLQLGKYITKIVALYGKEGRKANQMWVTLEIVKKLEGATHYSHNVGDQVQVCYSKVSDNFDVNVKRLISSLGADPEDVDTAMCMRIGPFWEGKTKEPPVSNVEGFPLEWDCYNEDYECKKEKITKTAARQNPIGIPTVEKLKDLGIDGEFDENVLADIEDADSAEGNRDAFWCYTDYPEED